MADNPFNSIGSSATNPFNNIGALLGGGGPPEDFPHNPISYVGGLIRNIPSDLGEMASGISGLLGAGAHDIIQGAEHLIPGQQAIEKDPSYVASIVKNFIPAIKSDYSRRYGSIHGLLSGLYNDPLSYVNDALMVGSGLSAVAKVGRVGLLTEAPTLVSDEVASRILGPALQQTADGTWIPAKYGEVPYGSLESGSGVERLKVSQNPVLRGAQNVLYKGLSKTPEALMALPELTQRQELFYKAADEAGIRVLRPSVSKFLAGRQSTNALSVLRLNIRDMDATSAKELLGDSTSPGIMRPIGPNGTPAPLDAKLMSEYAMAIKAPAVMPHVGAIQLESNLPDLAVAPEGLFNINDPAAREAAFNAAESIIGQTKGAEHAVGQLAPAAPHAGIQPNRLWLTVDSLDSAEKAAIDAAARAGYTTPLGKLDYLKNDATEWNQISDFFQNPDGHVLEIVPGTPDLRKALEAAAQPAAHAETLTAELVGIESELERQGVVLGGGNLPIEEQLKTMGIQGEDAADLVSKASRVLEIKRELVATKTWQSMLSDAVKAVYHSEKLGQPIEPEYLAALRIRPWLQQNIVQRWMETTKGASYAVMMDRAFGPQRVKLLYDMLGRVREGYAGIMGRGAEEAAPTATEAGAFKTGDTINYFSIDHRGEPALQEGTVQKIAPAHETTTKLQGTIQVPERYWVTGANNPHGIWVDAEAVQTSAPITAAGDQTAKQVVDLLKAEGIPDELINEITARLPRNPNKFVWNVRNVLWPYTVEEGAIGAGGAFPQFDWQVMAEQRRTLGLPMPSYYPHFSIGRPSDFMAQGARVGNLTKGSPGMAKNWEGTLFETGRVNMDAADVYARAARIWINHQETIDYIKSLVDKFGRPVDKAAADAAIKYAERTGEVYVNPDWVTSQLNLRGKMMADTLTGYLEHGDLTQATIDSARNLAANLREDAINGLAADQTVYAIPEVVARKLENEVKLTLNSPAFKGYDSVMKVWKASVLSLSPRWVLNNLFGNIIFTSLENPGALRFAIGQFSKENQALLRTVLDPEVLREVESGFFHTETSVAREASGAYPRISTAFDKLMETSPAKGVTATSHFIRTKNSVIEEAWRRGILLDAIQRGNLDSFSKLFWNSRQTLKDIAINGVNPSVMGRAITQVDRTLGNFMLYSPLEQGIIRRFIAPFYGFYRHMVKVAVLMPFEHPLKMRVLSLISQMDKQMEQGLPSYLQGQGGVNLTGLFGGDTLLRLKNLNPLSQLNEQLPIIGLLNPVLKVGLERQLGVDTFTGDHFPTPSDMVEDSAGHYWQVQKDAAGNVVGVTQAKPPLPSLLNHIASQIGVLSLIPDTTMFQRYPKSWWLNVASWFGTPLTQPSKSFADSAAFDQEMQQQALTTAQNEANTNPFNSITP